MGSHEGWVQPNGFYLNGLLPNEATSVTRVLDLNRWSIAEERIAELINCIQPNQPSEERRNAVAYYVQQLIAKCFSCEVFTFGSVPLKTYLPDGDIDLTAFSKNQNLKDAWANEVRDMLENEEKSEDAEFRVKEVQFIQAEVKIIKCLVENIVVDISFNQLGGLCTLCFLEEVDSLINQNHLFKRSIILIKAWCYYESRILGAHHGLISTYALETLVLYIFHVFNNSFAGPLEVLYRFLEFFSKFDWENFCVSLWGPVPISSLPDMTADPPRKDGRELLLSKVFLHACSSVYSVLPGGQENNELPFISKHFNVIDPLRTNNNLGRSVSKGNFFRIRSAFAFGAQRLARLLDCPKEKINAEVNQFFLNTLDRHGKGHRPDAPSRQLYGLQPINLNHVVRSDNLRNSSSSKQIKDNFVGRESELDMNHASHGVLSQNGNLPLKQMSRTNNVSAVSHTQSQKTYANLNGSVASYENHQMPPNCNGNTNAHFDKGRSCRPNYLGNEIYARYQFARTHSSPELTDTSTEISSQGKHYRASDTIEGQTAFARLDDSRRRNLGAEASDNNNARSSSEHLPPARRISSYQSIDAAVSSSSASNSYHGESGVSAMREDRTSVAETMQMHQEEQDFVNMMASSRFHSLSGHVQMPLNLASAHLPVPISPSILASMGYAHRNSAGVVPTSIASFEPPCGSNTHFPPNLVPVPVSQYTSSVGMASNRQKEIVEPIEDCFVSKETYQEDSDHGQWSKRDADSLGGFDPDNESFQARQVEKKDQFTSGGFTTVAASWVSSSESYSMKAHGSMKEDRQLIRKNYGDNPQHQSLRETNVNSASSRFLPASHATSSRSRPSSEGSWDGSSLRSSKSTRDRWGRKSSPSAERSTAYKNGWQYEGESVNHDSPLADDDNRDWIPLSTVDTEVAESMVPGTVASLLQSHQIPGYESAQMSGSTSMLPVAPVPVGSGSRRSMIDNNGVLPFTFYPTGPPVPFVTMLPFYSFPTEMETSDASAIHFDRDEEFNNSHISQSDQKSDSAENLDYPQTFSSNSVRVPVSVESSEEHKSDILNGDFASHWQSLQYGRLCQNPQNHGPLINQSPVVVPPMYIQGHFTWDGPGRPLSTNANLFTQLMGYGAGIIPVSPLQSGSNRPANVYQQFGDEIPRYRGGTGTYLPNPKISSRDRQSSNTRNNRGNYSFDRKDHHADREGNWNINSKQRFAGHGQGRNQVEKPNTRMDRSKASNGRSDRPWGSFKYDTSHSNRSRIGPFSPSTSTHSGSTNVAYGMYQLPVMNPNGVPPSGTTVPSVVMLYPYDQNMGCSSPAEQLEFGSLGPMHFSGINEGMQLGQGTSRGANEQLNFLVNSEHSSPDPPSSPKNQRSTAQRNYQLKDADFPLLSPLISEPGR